MNQKEGALVIQKEGALVNQKEGALVNLNMNLKESPLVNKKEGPLVNQKEGTLLNLKMNLKESPLVNHKEGPLNARLWIEETNDLVAIDTEISLNLKGLIAIEIATAVRKKSIAAFATAIWFFETPPPRRERELDR